MKIRGERLKELAAAAGVTPEALAQAVERPSLRGERAASAVRNWMANRDHPRCKPQDVQRLCERLGCKVPDLVKFTSSVVRHRGSPRKAGLVVDLVRGKPVDKALNLLTFTTKRAAVNVKKALQAAIADAERSEADVTALYVCESRVDKAPVIKRFQPKDRGRAHPILKRSSNITISVQERD